MLITIAIIGVVAVLTIPTLVANYQEKGWNTSATVFERKLEESLKIMNTQGTLAGYRTTEAFVAELQKHLKITKVCKNDDILSCFEDKVYWGQDSEEVDMSKIKTAKNFGQKDWDTNIVGIQLANGTTGLVAYNPECKQNQYSNQITGTSCLAILYDTSAYAKPNTQNKDLRSINVVSLGGKECTFEVAGTCYGTPFKPTPMTFEECSANTEELASLGIKKCYDNNYWAGAVKQCGGINKVPTLVQLAEIANYVYNTNVVDEMSRNEDLTRDTAKFSSMGLSVDVDIMSNYFNVQLYYGDEYPYTLVRAFGSGITAAGQAGIDYSNFYAVCIVD